jgi:hypothetical protein
VYQRYSMNCRLVGACINANSLWKVWLKEHKPKLLVRGHEGLRRNRLTRTAHWQLAQIVIGCDHKNLPDKPEVASTTSGYFIWLIDFEADPASQQN